MILMMLYMLGKIAAEVNLFSRSFKSLIQNAEFGRIKRKNYL